MRIPARAGLAWPAAASAVRAGLPRAGAAFLAGTAIALSLARPAQAAVPGPAAVPGTYPVCRSWTDHAPMAARMSSRIRAVLRRRVSLVALRVADPALGLGCWLGGDRHFDSASVMKATILAALLRKAHVQRRSLTRRERALAWLMITQSDNTAATALWNDAGMYSIRRFLSEARMRETRLSPSGAWGLTQITAHDEMILLQRLLTPNAVLTQAARRYELRLMAHVIAGQRWGVPAGVPTSYTVHVKNGWLPTPPDFSWWVNSIGCFTRPGNAYSIVVLTHANPDMPYGVTTIEDLAEIINRQVNPGAVATVARALPSPAWGAPDEPIP